MKEDLRERGKLNHKKKREKLVGVSQRLIDFMK